MKWLLALALMVALGNTAAAGPFGVSMREPIKPNVGGGWDDYGYGIERREYQGSLPFPFIYIEGTRKGGACGVSVLFDNHGDFKDLWTRLTRKYGKPSIFAHNFLEWVLSENPDKITEIVLMVNTKAKTDLNRMLRYRFENHHECENAKEAARKAEEAAEKAKTKRKDADL